jgi:hypothetical protein
VRLVEQVEGASLARPAAQLIVEAGLRLYNTEVRQHRLCYHARHVARFECLSQSIWVVEGDQAEVALPGAVHSPSSEQPGAISDQLTRDFAASGFPLATGATPVGTPNRLVEVYPHPALMTLTGASYRLPYKVSRSRKYWPKSSPAERRARLLTQFAQIASALKGEIRDIPIELPEPDSMISTSGLKRYEDSLDALVCSWVGA